MFKQTEKSQILVFTILERINFSENWVQSCNSRLPSAQYMYNLKHISLDATVKTT